MRNGFPLLTFLDFTEMHILLTKTQEKNLIRRERDQEKNKKVKLPNNGFRMKIMYF